MKDSKTPCNKIDKILYFSFINSCRVPTKLFEHEANRPCAKTSLEGPAKFP